MHVDDLLVAGNKNDLIWLKSTLDKYFESRSSILGDSEGESQEIAYLNRRIRWNSDGITYEHDPAHVRTILGELGLLQCASVNSPGVKEDERKADSDCEKELPPSQATTMRRVIALFNYIAQDRADIGYAVKEVSRDMAKPTLRTVQRVKRLGRYIKGQPPCVLKYAWQVEPDSLITYTDSDWAGCVRTRRSTSGGVIFRGSHPIKSWSRTQANVALSSAEAELAAIVKGSTEMIGLGTMLEELGMGRARKWLYTDSSVANGAVHRQGSGRMKHVPTHCLWVQERSRLGEITYKKIGREANCADVLTHHWSAAAAHVHLQRMGQEAIVEAHKQSVPRTDSRGSV